jgi:hypothetical protein
MRKLVLLALLALSFLATARTSRVIGPIPTCNPCDWVR